MAKKKEFDYFEALVQLAEKIKIAGEQMLEVVENYTPEMLAAKTKTIHELEHEGDKIVHSVKNELNHSFITPIDREDIVLITDSLDDVLDEIHTITYKFDSYLIKKMRPQAQKMAQYIVEATEGVHVVSKEFSKFKNSKTLGNMIVHVNDVEEKADTLFHEAVKDLFSNETDVLEVVKWKAIYESLEEVMDKAEKAADVMAGLVIKNG